jgi:hypothetical protein
MLRGAITLTRDLRRTFSRGYLEKGGSLSERSDSDL